MTQVAGVRAALPTGPKDIQTFSKAEDRDRLSAVALKAFKALSLHWGLTGAESAALLGVSESTWDRLKRAERGQVLSQDQLTRASAAIGLYKGLKLLFAGDMAIKWPKLVNSGPIFQRRTPIDAMIEGGIPLMLETRQYIDAVRGGL